jgi:hypothetical protein
MRRLSHFSSFVKETPVYTMWREEQLLHVKLHGNISDDESLIWRTAVDDHTAVKGWPRYVVLDVSEALSVGSMGSRVRTAAWGRLTLKQVREGVIYSGAEHMNHFVTRAILRLVGMPNISVIGDLATLEAAFERFRA